MHSLPHSPVTEVEEAELHAAARPANLESQVVGSMLPRKLLRTWWSSTPPAGAAM
jgi:hypothetical protein